MHNVLVAPTDTLFHNWRKRAKYLRHQLEALNVLDPAGMGATEAHFETLTDLLGDDHDLAVLWHRLSDDRRLADGLDLSFVLEAITRRRDDLQQGAVELGSDLYAATPDDFLGSIEAMWGDGPTF
jgi:CHAD domain-containing protein